MMEWEGITNTTFNEYYLFILIPYFIFYFYYCNI